MTAPTTVDLGWAVLTVDEARAAGLLPEQVLSRRRESVAILEAYGHGDTPEARALRAAVARASR